MKLSEHLGSLINQMRELDERQERLIDEHVRKTNKLLDQLDQLDGEVGDDLVASSVKLLEERGWTLIPPKQ